MSYIYINFVTYRDRKKWEAKGVHMEIYDSLNKQFENLQQALSIQGIHVDTLEDFVHHCFPPFENTFHISLPAFDRKFQKNDIPTICNIVLRPEHQPSMDMIMPPHTEVLFICDIEFRDSITSLVVKGIELMDRNVVRFGERSLQCTPAVALTRYNNNIPNYGVRDWSDSLLTKDMILSLCEEVYPIPEPEKAIRQFEEWEAYLSFREYYLSEQKKKFIPVDDIQVNMAYLVKGRDYRDHEEELAPHRLPGDTRQVKANDTVVIDEEFSEIESETVPVVTVICRKNRQELQSDMVENKNGKKVPAFERELFSFTRNYVSLGSTANRNNELLFEERLMMPCQVEVEPDLTNIERHYAKIQEDQLQQLEEKFQYLIQGKLREYRVQEKNALEEQFSQLMRQYQASCKAEIEEKRRNGGIPEIEAKYQEELQHIVQDVNSKYQKQTIQLERKITDLQKKQKGLQSRLNSPKKKKKKPAVSDMEKLNAELAELQEQIDSAVQESETLKHTIQQETEERTSAVSLDSYYDAMLTEMYNTQWKKEMKTSERLLEEHCQTYQSELEIQYQPEMDKEKQNILTDLSRKKEREIYEKKEAETEIHYYIYFKLDHMTSIESAKHFINAEDSLVMRYNARADEAKLSRQKHALDSLRAGYVKNPFLAFYLFCPSSLPAVSIPHLDGMKWNLESLNDRQREAVCRAVSSNSLFLLQGPPGTGKTQVIAEIAAHLAKSGKKVLISSETHKAIDNVFERLPKIPEIRPIRLINQTGKKKSDYSIEDLLNNFYRNISDGLQKQIRRFENFEEYRMNFDENMQELLGLYQKMRSLEQEYQKIQVQKESFQSKISDLDKKINDLNEKIDEYRLCIHDVKEYRRYLKEFRISDTEIENTEEAYQPSLRAYRMELEQLLQNYPQVFFDLSTLSELIQLSGDVIQQELRVLSSGNPELARLRSRKAELRQKIEELLDPDTLDPLPENESIHNALKKEFKKVGKELKELEANDNGQGFDTLFISKFVKSEILADAKSRKNIPEILSELQQKIRETMELYTKQADEKLSDAEENYTLLTTSKNALNYQKIEIDKQKQDLEDNQSAQEYADAEARLKTKIRSFFLDFDIRREYRPDHIQESIAVIQEEWNQLGESYQMQKQENNVKIPMYRNIVNFLGKEPDEEEKMEYIPTLFENVNIFGMTCTSRDYFSARSLEGAEKYGIGDLYMHHIGIDVVIVDEVSKSAFLDLLIPILYGKTVILVGDHRQLPPMYDLKHLRREDFYELEPEYITFNQNQHYTELFETCYFKTLFEQVPETYKIMLNKQYRCHSDIMDVFNYFYGGNGLSIGMANQNDTKQHDLTVKINGRMLIEPSKHIYFIDCEKKESRVGDSSSVQNEQEAEVIISLLRQIDLAAKERNKLLKHRGSRIPRLSAGVICTYGDQAGLIKRKIAKNWPKNLSEDQGERFIISTVDDFQGDERDIILVSMVRNHDRIGTAKFLQQFERINVAFSRARTLLIIVGSEKFLSRNPIDLPDVNGDSTRDKKRYLIYRDIIETIKAKGHFLTAESVLSGGKLND